MEFLKIAFTPFICALLFPVSSFAYPGDLSFEETPELKSASVSDAKASEMNREEQKEVAKRAEQEKAEEKSTQEAAEKAAEKERAKVLEREYAEASKKMSDEFNQSLCKSSAQYIETLKFLRSTKIIILTENTSRLIADKVSKSCDGGADRFIKVLTLLKTVGLSDAKSLELALDFSSRPVEVQRNFIEIFNHSFLAEFMDYDYRTAANLAFELSKDYKGDPVQVREDFLELVRFCKAKDKLDLPIKICAEYTIKLARLTQYHPKGIRAPFYRLYDRFREDPTFAMDIRTALELAYNVLKYGPNAVENFFTAYDFASSEEGLNLTHAASLDFSVRMASRSFKGQEPPLVPNSASPVVLRNAASVR